VEKVLEIICSVLLLIVLVAVAMAVVKTFPHPLVKIIVYGFLILMVTFLILDFVGLALVGVGMTNPYKYRIVVRGKGEADQRVRNMRKQGYGAKSKFDSREGKNRYYRLYRTARPLKKNQPKSKSKPRKKHKRKKSWVERWLS
jgi:hypothetical protein